MSTTKKCETCRYCAIFTRFDITGREEPVLYEVRCDRYCKQRTIKRTPEDDEGGDYWKARGDLFKYPCEDRRVDDETGLGFCRDQDIFVDNEYCINCVESAMPLDENELSEAEKIFGKDDFSFEDKDFEDLDDGDDDPFAEGE